MSKHSAAADDLDRREANITRTRAALARKLGILRDRVLGPPEPAASKGRTIMATRKAASAHAGNRKSSAKKPTTSKSQARTESKSHAGSSHKGRGTKVVTSKMVGKTKAVLEDALAGAAVGAVKGAAQAVLEDMASGPGKGQRSRKHKSKQ